VRDHRARPGVPASGETKRITSGASNPTILSCRRAFSAATRSTVTTVEIHVIVPAPGTDARRFSPHRDSGHARAAPFRGNAIRLVQNDQKEVMHPNIPTILRRHRLRQGGPSSCCRICRGAKATMGVMGATGWSAVAGDLSGPDMRRPQCVPFQEGVLR